jgi:hypothetical protein
MQDEGRDILLALGHAPWATPGHGDISVASFLRYDANLNGGFPDSSLSVGDLRFAIAEENRAVSGMLAGVSAFGSWRKGLGEGLALETSGFASLGAAPMHGFLKLSLAGEACLRKVTRIDRALHACLDGDHHSDDLGRSDRAGLRVGATAIVPAAGGLHEAGAEIRLDRHLDVEGGGGAFQPVLSVSTVSAMPGSGWFARADLGVPAGNFIVTRAALRVGSSWMMADRPVSVSVQWRRISGGRFMGEPRTDDEITLSAGLPLTEKVSLSVSVGRNLSTAAPFDRTIFDAGVSLHF